MMNRFQVAEEGFAQHQLPSADDAVDAETFQADVKMDDDEEVEEELATAPSGSSTMAATRVGVKRKSDLKLDSASPRKTNKVHDDLDFNFTEDSEDGDDDDDEASIPASSTKKHVNDSDESTWTVSADFDPIAVFTDDEETWHSAVEGEAAEVKEEGGVGEARRRFQEVVEDAKVTDDEDSVRAVAADFDPKAVFTDEEAWRSAGEEGAAEVGKANERMMERSKPFGRTASEDATGDSYGDTSAGTSADDNADASTNTSYDNNGESDDDDDAAAEAEAERLRRTISELKAECARLTEERRRIEEEEEKRRRERERLAAEIDRAKAEFARLKAECDRLKRHLAKQEEEIARLRLYLMIAREMKEKATGPEE